MSRAPVLVVGGGPVGMGAALLLARHGVASTVVERQPALGHHPKARGFRVRTMELLRALGVEEELRRDALPREALRFIYCETLAGREIARTPPPPAAESAFSPSEECRVPQDVAERLLRERVAAEPAIDLRLGVECTGIAQDADGVTATLRDADGREERLDARYAIAADGVGSRLRAALGIAFEGNPLLAYWQSVFWRGDIDALTADRLCIQFFTGAHTGRFVTVATVDPAGRWVTLLMLPPSEQRPAAPSPQEARELVRAAVGLPDLDVEVLDVATWRVSAQVAGAFRAGRVFLAGDAAHALPPTGGFGVNTGLQDVHNLAWKLALVLRGAAPAALLDSYEQERRPIALANVAWSTGNAGVLGDVRAAIAAGDEAALAAALDRQRRHVTALKQDLGFRYDAGALVPEPPEPPAPPQDPDALFAPSARPGARAPHVWLEADGERRSTLDLFDRRFVLLAGPDGSAWADAAREAAAALDLELDAHVAGGAGDLGDPDGAVPGAYGIEAGGAVLVRPDGHVAWRARDGAGASAEAVHAVLEAVLRR